MYIAVNSIYVTIFKCGYHCRKYTIAGIEIITVKYSYDIACRHCDTLVHGIVYPFVFLADIAQATLILRFQFMHDFHCVIS